MILALIEESELPEQVITVLQGHANACQQMEDLFPFVQVCTCSPCYEDPSTHKIQLKITSDLHHVASQVLRALVILGGKIKFGSASRTGLERETQEALDEVLAASSFE